MQQGLKTMLDSETTKEIVRRVLQATDVERIILFGSAATGTMNADSDVDLLVLKDSVTNPIAESVRIDAAMSGLKYPFDIFVMSKASFENTKDVIGSLAWPANHGGRVLYDAA